MTNLDQFTRAPQGSFKLQRKLLAATVAACFGVAQANPTLPQVVAGQATFAQQGNVFSITNTPNTIINWQSFSVGRDEITRFIQQSSDSKVLNRITGQDPSQILGSLQSNGQVFLINPNGVLFGKDARIDVNGLVASSLQLSNTDFLAGKHNFNGEAGAGKVVNQGSITTPQGGKVFLIAPTVENHGVISAPNGEILLAAGKSVQLVDSANPAITVVVSAPEDQVLNLGQIVAQGGRVGIYGALVNQRGVVNANSAVRGGNGKIILKASRNTVLEAGSQTTASGAGKGGEIQILGQNVALNGNARVDASGKEGGGTVLVGGDYQGKNSAVQNARQAFIGKNAVIRADAEASGDGGRVIVWADEATRAYGAISARSAGGKGGFVETSGHYLDVAGLRVDTTGLDATGVWLLDPYNIEVVSTSYGAYGLADVADFNGGLPSPATTQILASTINSATSNVVLQATNDIDFNTSVSMTAAGKSLTAYAGNDINVNANLQTNGGAIGLYANYAPSGSASGHGAVNLAASRTINSGAADITLSGISVALNGSVTATPGGARTGDNAPVISLRANNLDIAGSVNNSAGEGGYVSIAPFISTYNMALMDADSPSAGTMVLNTADLGRVHAYEVALGGASVGSVSISGSVALDANLVVDAKSTITHGGAIDANGHSVFFNVYDDTGSINGNYGTFTDVDTLRLRADNFNYSGVTNSIVANKVYIDKQDLSADISLGGTNPAAAYLSESELKMFDAPLINIGTASGYSGAIEVSESLDLSGSNAATTRGGTTGQLLLQGRTIEFNDNLAVNDGLKLVASDLVSQTSAIAAQRMTISAAGGDIYLNNVGNEIATINLDGQNISYSGQGGTTVEGLRQRNGSEPGEANLYISGGTLTLKNTDVQNHLNIDASTVSVADAGSVKAGALHLDVHQFAVQGSGAVTATESVTVSAGGSVTLGGTLTSVEGGLLLNNTTLGAITTPLLTVVGGEEGNIELQSLALPNTRLSLNAFYGEVRNRGVVSAKSIAMSGREFDLGASSTSLTASELFSIYATGDYGRLAITSSTPADTTAISADALGHITAGTLVLGGAEVRVAEAITRSSGNLSLNAYEGTVELNAPVTVNNGGLDINAGSAVINQAAWGNRVMVTAESLAFGATGGITASDFVNLASSNDVYVGGSATSADGLLLNNDTLGKISTASLHVTSYNGDVVAAGIDRGTNYLGLHAAQTLRTEGDIKARGISLSAESFDIGTASSLDAGTGVLTISGSQMGDGTLQVNGTGGDGISLFNSSALSRVVSNRVQFDAYNGVTVAGDLVTGKELLFTSGQGKVQINALVDTGDTGRIDIQSKEVGIAHRIHAGTVTLAPLARYNPDTNTQVPASMVIGGDCTAALDCMAIKDLAQVDAANVVLGNKYSTSTMLVKGIGGTGSTARHANTTSITLRARDGISQDGAIKVNTLWAGTDGSTVLKHAENLVAKLGADTDGGMLTQNLSFNNNGNLTYEGGVVSGTIDLAVAGDLKSGTYTMVADKLKARVWGSVGGEGALWTQVKKLDVETTASAGKSSITINNNNATEPGALNIERLVVHDGNTGAITLNNYGATSIAATTDVDGNVRSGSGAIAITAHSPLTVNGKVASLSGAVTLEAGASATPSNDVLNIGSAGRVQSGGTVLLKGGSAVNYNTTQVAGSTVTKMVNGVVVNPPPVNPPPVNPPPVDPPPVNPPPVNPPPVNPPPVDPPPVNPPPVNPPPVDPPPVNPPPVNPPPVDPPPVNPPPVNPPPVNPPPTADICTIAPNSALCQVLTPPTASEPVKPVDRAVAQVINVINTSQDDAKPAGSSGSSSSGSTGKASGPVKTDDKKEEKKEDKKDEKSSDSSTKQDTKNEPPPPKSYCN